MSALATIHAKRRQLHSLQEDEAWRDFVEKQTGQRSTRGLTPKQSQALLAALDALCGGKSPRRRTLSGPYVKKIQALWIACWNLGLVRSRDDGALNAFVVRQSGVDHANWMRDHPDAVAVIEALKKMLARRGVHWTIQPDDPKHAGLPGFRIASAQWQRVKAEAPFAGHSFEGYVVRLTGRALADMTASDWIVVMNALGRHIRS